MAAGGMTISAFAKAGGVGVETVRYYQRRGLLPVPGAGRSSFRVYDAALLRRLRFIRRLQSAGFTLTQIGDLLRLDRTTDRLRIQALAAGKLAELRGQIRDLRSVARSLEQLLDHCRHAPAGERCPIVEAFDP